MAIKLNELNGILVRCWIARTNVLFKSKPALGKTETVEAFIARMQKKVEGFRGWKFYVPSMSPMDIQASCPDKERGVLALYNNELLPNHYTDPEAKGVLFFDEVLNGDPATTKLLQKYMNREDMGSLKLPEGVIVIGASNSLEHKSGVQQQGRAFMSRMEQHDVYSDPTDNIEFASKHGWHPNVQLYFKDNPAQIDNYDEVFQTSAAAAKAIPNSAPSGERSVLSEEGKNGIWANMRSWERLSRKEFAADEVDSPVTLSEAVGNLGTGVGSAYHAHKAARKSLASFAQIMENPKAIALPQAMDEQYALAMIVALRCHPGQMPQVRSFGERLPLELQAVILRNLSIRKNFDLASAGSYVEWISNAQLTKLLNGR
jgi:hypothetical protein